MAGKSFKHTVSILTSSSDVELSRLAREYGPEVNTAELYVFREIDLLELGLAAGDSTNLVDILNECSRSDVEWWAKELKLMLGEPNAPRLKPIAIATYLPQIASPERHTDAVKALSNILLLAQELDIRCVEMVCGRVSERCPRTSSGNRCEAILYRSRRDDIIPLLVNGLGQLRDFASKLDKPVAVALEIEPGPFYVLNDLEEAGIILEMTSGSEWKLNTRNRAYHFVGLNIDIGHMLICHETGLGPRKLPLDRIYNFHISDNAELHFADLVPGTIHSIHPECRGSFADWLHCYRCVCTRGNKLIFRGNLSVELEACPYPQWVHKAIRNTRYMLQELEATVSNTDSCEKCPHCL